MDNGCCFEYRDPSIVPLPQVCSRPSGNRIGMMRGSYPSHHPTKVDLNAEVGPGDIITVEESF